MTARHLIESLSAIHTHNDPIITKMRVLTELYEMKDMCDNKSREIRQAIRTLSKQVNREVKKKNQKP